MNFDRLTDFLDSLTQWRIPGLDCVVHHQGRQVYRHSAGYADIAIKRRISPDALYFMYSVSKIVTCTAALQLFEKGAFLLTDPVSAYLPEFGEMLIRKADGLPVQAANAINIRDLFMMTAGLDYDVDTPSIRAVRERTGGACPTMEIIRAIAENPLLFEPGTHWNYSLCHDVLAGLVEAVSGQTFGSYVRDHIFQPIGMSSSGYALTCDIKQRMAPQYRFDPRLNRPEAVGLANEYVLGPLYESGGAGLISSVDDLVLFAETLCRKGKVQNGGRILSSRTVDLMRTNHLGPSLMTDFHERFPHTKGYGYGLGVHTMADKAAGGSLSPIGEFGWRGAAGSYVIIDPENEVSVVYVQHMLDSHEPYVYDRLRNIAYACLDD